MSGDGRGAQGLAEDIESALGAIAAIDAVPTILEVVCRTTGMGFAAIARVTEDSWIACAVRDEIAFGLEPGGELEVETTICDEIREHGEPVIIDACRAGPGLLRPSDARNVRLPELYLDADPPLERRFLRHALRDRSAPGAARPIPRRSACSACSPT